MASENESLISGGDWQFQNEQEWLGSRLRFFSWRMRQLRCGGWKQPFSLRVIPLTASQSCLNDELLIVPVAQARVMGEPLGLDDKS